jgi:hypothetical protein
MDASYRLPLNSLLWDPVFRGAGIASWSAERLRILRRPCVRGTLVVRVSHEG